jgi:hypothetical protein
MRIVIDRDLCDASLPFCARCSAAFLRWPEGSDRPCIREIIEDGRESLTLELVNLHRVIEIELSEEQRNLASVEGWEVLANFDPALFREGAEEKWREIRSLPVRE